MALCYNLVAMKASPALYVLFVLLVSASATAQVWSGDITVHGLSGAQLVQACSPLRYVQLENGAVPVPEKDMADAAQCMGYIWGVVSMLEVYQKVCLPVGVTSHRTSLQMVKMVLKYADQHPEELNYSALVLIAPPIENAFPCKRP
ncbi:MAG: hypothetical protein CXZ00_07770 [Acidobacteria bacterium]|nr:MAG: hypothetical protein CXZ00_07770 [Acidobacteriota bacterium]